MPEETQNQTNPKSESEIAENPAPPENKSTEEVSEPAEIFGGEEKVPEPEKVQEVAEENPQPLAETSSASPQTQTKITPQGRTSPVAPLRSGLPQALRFVSQSLRSWTKREPPRGTTFSRDFVQNLLIKARARIQERKRKKLDKIIWMLSDKKQIANKDVQKLLRVSDTSATRYLDILEGENKIKQVGKTGNAVFYTKI